MLEYLDPLRTIPAALALGVMASAFAWPLRKSQQGRRTFFAIWLAVLAVAVAVSIEQAVWLNASGRVPPGSEVAPPLPLGFKVARATWLFLAVNALLQLFDLLIWEGVLARLRQTRVPRLLINVFNVFVLVLTGLFIASRVFELPLSTLVVSSTVASAVLGLALQDVLRSMVAGIVLQVESPFSLGDWVEVGGYEGVITQMNWRTVTLRTRLRHHVVLTNGGVSSGNIINYSRPARLQGVDAFIGVAYEHPPEQVKAVLAEALRGTPGVSKLPPPRLFTVGYGDFAINYRARYWITDYAALRETEDAVMTRMWYALQRAGMTIPFPIRDVNLRTVPEDAAARRAADQRLRIESVLAPLPLLEPLDETQIGQLAGDAAVQRFASGEALMREGEEGSTAYVVRTGRAEVQVTGADGSPVTVAEREAGDIMGEMSLLTGAPRSATVIAGSELEVIVIDKRAFGEVLLADPTIAERLSEILAERELEQAQRVAEAGAALPSQTGLRDEILGRIRQFFALG